MRLVTLDIFLIYPISRIDSKALLNIRASLDFWADCWKGFGVQNQIRQVFGLMLKGCD